MCSSAAAFVPPNGAIKMQRALIYTRVYVNHGGAWLLAANHIAPPSEHVQPSGIGS
jgi:hypothetical protein